MSALLSLLKLFDLLVDSVVGELSKKHFFLLSDELVNVLSTLLLWKLDTAASDVHGLMDVVLLFHVEVFLLGVVLSWRNVSVPHAT